MPTVIAESNEAQSSKTVITRKKSSQAYKAYTLLHDDAFTSLLHPFVHITSHDSQLHNPKETYGKKKRGSKGSESDTNLIHEEVEVISFAPRIQMLVPPHEICEHKELEHRVHEPNHVHRLRVPKPHNRIKQITNSRTLRRKNCKIFLGKFSRTATGCSCCRSQGRNPCGCRRRAPRAPRGRAARPQPAPPARCAAEQPCAACATGCRAPPGGRGRPP